MAQQQHNNLQILQVKNNKSSLKPWHYIMFGFISGVICCATILFLYFSFGSNTELSPQIDPNKEGNIADNFSDQSTQIEDDKTMTSVNEAQLSGLFKPPTNQTNNKTDTATPFSSMSENKTERPRNTEKSKVVIEKPKPVAIEKTTKTKEAVKPATDAKTDRPADRTPESKPEKKPEVSSKNTDDLPPPTIHAAIQGPLQHLG